MIHLNCIVNLKRFRQTHQQLSTMGVQDLSWLLQGIMGMMGETRSKEPYFSGIIYCFSSLVSQNSYLNSYPLHVYNFRPVLFVILLELPESFLKLCVRKGRCSKEMLGQVSKNTEKTKGKSKLDILKNAIAPTNCKVQRKIANHVNRVCAARVSSPCVLVGV